MSETTPEPEPPDEGQDPDATQEIEAVDDEDE